MNIKRKIARWLGYGGIEWPKSGITDMPIMFVPRGFHCDANVMQTCCYPGGVQVLHGEFGCDGRHRLLLRTK